MSWSGYIPGELVNDPKFVEAYLEHVSILDEYAPKPPDYEPPYVIMLQGEDREIISSA